MHGIELAKKELLDNNYTCVFVQGKEVVMTSFDRGVKPLITYYETKKDMQKSAVLADKVIGQAAALLAVLCGITAIYTPVISEDAIKVLNKNGIFVTYEQTVPYIVNRSGNGRCPMEELSMGVNEPLDMYKKIKKWIMGSIK